MENTAHALFIAFAIFVFVIAFSVTMFMMSKLNATAKVLVFRLDKTNYYDSLVLNEIISNNNDEDINNKTERVVGTDTIIPTLYRYYKESFSVKILDTNGNLLQLFDTTTEGDVMTATSTLANKRTPEQRALLSLYGASRDCNMFGAPWLGSTNKDAKERIDMYINGTAGYINNTWVDYTNNNLNQYNERKFKEIFTQYAYEGDTRTENTYNNGTEATDELITLTGTKQVSTKIVITYQLLN